MTVAGVALAILIFALAFGWFERSARHTARQCLKAALSTEREAGGRLVEGLANVATADLVQDPEFLREVTKLLARVRS